MEKFLINNAGLGVPLRVRLSVSSPRFAAGFPLQSFTRAFVEPSTPARS